MCIHVHRREPELFLRMTDRAVVASKRAAAGSSILRAVVWYVPPRIRSRRRLPLVWFVVGLCLLLSAACNSRSPLFENAATPTAPTAVVGVLFGLSVTPTGVMGGTPVTGLVGLTGTAPVGGLLVSLSSNSAAVTLPAAVTVPAGADRATFPITTRAVVADVDASIVATTPAGSAATTLGVWSEQPTYLSLGYEPSPGGHIVGRRFTPSTAAFTLSCSGSGLTVSVPGSTAHRVFLSAPTGTPLRTGTYENASSTFARPAGPSLDVGGPDINACSAQSARFVVHEAQFGAGTEPVRRFSATFERRCSAGTMSVWGELRLTGVPNNSFGSACLR